MSVVRQCRTCRKNIVYPAYLGDGAFPVPPMCVCPGEPNPRPAPPPTFGKGAE